MHEHYNYTKRRILKIAEYSLTHSYVREKQSQVYFKQMGLQPLAKHRNTVTLTNIHR